MVPLGAGGGTAVGSKIGTVLAVPLLALVAVATYLALDRDYRSSAIAGGIVLVSIVIAVIVAKPKRQPPPPARLEATVALPPHKVAQRAEVSAMFANLARRSSRLVDALIE